MAISFHPVDLVTYLFCCLPSGTYELDAKYVARFIHSFESELMTKGHKYIYIQDIDNLPEPFVHLEGQEHIICTDVKSIVGKNTALEEKYDTAYGNIVVSSSLRKAAEKIIQDIAEDNKQAGSPLPTSMGNDDNLKNPYNGKIFCLMGKSASGKDTVYAEVRNSFEELGLRQLVMYTTRPKRTGEENGHEYNFVSAEELEAMDNAGKVIERRDYDTIYGIWSYAIVDDEQLCADQDYVIKEETPAGYQKLVEHFGKEHVIPIYIYVEDGVRLLRALSREMGQDNPRYDEMCRRYLSDCGDFAEIDSDESMTRFVNDNIEKCANDIVEHIRNVLGK